MSEHEGSSKSAGSGGSSGPSSGSSRMDSTGSRNDSTSGSGVTSSTSSGVGPSAHSGESSSTSTQHSHIPSQKASVCGASVTDSAYSGSNTQRSGSGSGSRSSKSQISSNSSNNTCGDQQSNKSRKDKELKSKRKSKASFPPVQQSQQQVPVDRPASAASNKVVATSAATSLASATAVASACNTGTVECVGLHPPPSPAVLSADSTGNNSCSGNRLILNNPRPKLPRASGGIRGVTESRAVQAAALSRALDCLGKATSPSSPTKESLKVKEDSIPSPWRSSLLDLNETNWKKTFAHLEELPTVKSKDAFVAAISLQDGIVVYVTPTLTDKLGYPCEMWCGRSLLDFIHPKDRLAFTNQITSKLLASLDKEDSLGCSFASDDGNSPRGMIGSTSAPPNMLCSRLRMYRGLRTSGFGIVDKKTSYLPFRINLNLEKIRLQGHSADAAEANADAAAAAVEEESDDDSAEYYLLAHAVPITTAYKVSEEKSPPGQFGLRHSANCLYSEVDMSSVPYLGHLPQDLLGTSALEFYHPNDLPELKKVYDSVIGRQGKSIRSKPYNFRAFNGCYVLLETDWTCFVNPWSKKLEFVSGHHRVLKGPSNPDVFANPPEGTGTLLESLDSATAESVKKLHAEIRTILTGSPMPPQPQRKSSQAEATLQENMSLRRKTLGTLMAPLIDEVDKQRGSNSGGSHSSGSHNRGKGRLRAPLDGSISDDVSVVMGDISTHGGSVNESNSADSPLSYSMLNYNQNLERYFQSQPKMMPSDGSAENSEPRSNSADSKSASKTPNMSSEEEGCFLGVDGSQMTGPSDSQQLSSSNSKSNSNSTDGKSQNSGSSEGNEYKGPPLTKEMLGRHNEEMEKEFMQQHRDLKNKSALGRRSARGLGRKESHGVKRGQAASWEDCGSGAGARNKHPHMDDFCATPHCYQSPPSTALAPGPFNDWALLAGPSVIPPNLLPPFSVVNAMPASGSRPYFSMANRGEMVQPVSAYYLPTGNANSDRPVTYPMEATVHHQPSYGMSAPHQHQQFPLSYGYHHGIIYQPVMVPQPVLYQPGVGMMMPNMPGRQHPRGPDEGRYRDPTGEMTASMDSVRIQAGLSTSSGPRPGPRRAPPPWMESVSPSPQLVYQYQMPSRNTHDVLEADRQQLELLEQPSRLNSQLQQLYAEQEAEQRPTVFELFLEEGDNSTSSSNAGVDNSQWRRLRRRSAEFRRSMLYDENAPFPDPASSSTE